MKLRTSYDREIVRIAVPALGALAAEPLYVLVDTAIVGHLGTQQLAALAVAATLLSSFVALCNFLTYGTTARVARLLGAGQDAAAGRIAAQALWLAVFIGVGLAVGVAVLASPLASLMGADGETHSLCVTYLRISALGLPFALIALSGQGYLRGADQLRRPLIVVLAGNAVNVRARGAVRLRVRLGHRRVGVGDGDRAGRDGDGVRDRAACARRRRRGGRRSRR